MNEILARPPQTPRRRNRVHKRLSCIRSASRPSSYSTNCLYFVLNSQMRSAYTLCRMVISARTRWRLTQARAIEQKRCIRKYFSSSLSRSFRSAHTKLDRWGSMEGSPGKRKRLRGFHCVDYYTCECLKGDMEVILLHFWTSEKGAPKVILFSAYCWPPKERLLCFRQGSEQKALEDRSFLHWYHELTCGQLQQVEVGLNGGLRSSRIVK